MHFVLPSLKFFDLGMGKIFFSKKVFPIISSNLRESKKAFQTSDDYTLHIQSTVPYTAFRRPRYGIQTFRNHTVYFSTL